jgi:nucleoside-diphosphate-sugar epimerase
MERVAGRWAGRLPILIVRPFNYTGVRHGERFLIPKLIKAFKSRSDDVSFVEAGVVRDFSDVRWVADVYVSLLEKTRSGLAVNVCSGRPTPLPELVRTLERLTGHRLRVPPAGGAAVRDSLVGSPARLKAMLPALLPYGLEDTLRWMLHSETDAA